jgi:hypothetical protein
MTAWAGDDDDDDEQIPLCRIEYLGDDKDRGFAIYDPATGPAPRALRTSDSPPDIPATPSAPPPSSTLLV